MSVIIPKHVQKRILDEARVMVCNGKRPAVLPLCRRNFLDVTKPHRRAVGELLDKANIERRRCNRDGVKTATSPSDFGVKFEAMSRVFVGISSPDDVDLYLVERAKAGNERAMEILKKLVG